MHELNFEKWCEDHLSKSFQKLKSSVAPGSLPSKWIKQENEEDEDA